MTEQRFITTGPGSNHHHPDCTTGFHSRHELLEPGDAAEGVAEVAFRWGFTHLGRFAARYAELYGETPSQTLRG